MILEVGPWNLVLDFWILKVRGIRAQDLQNHQEGHDSNLRSKVVASAFEPASGRGIQECRFVWFRVTIFHSNFIKGPWVKSYLQAEGNLEGHLSRGAWQHVPVSRSDGL